MKANCSGSRTKLGRGTFVPLSSIKPKSPRRPLSLAGLWAFLLPLRGGSIIKALRGETRPSSTFSFVRGHRLCRDEGRGGHLKSPPLIHHTHMQCTYRMSKRESTKEKKQALPHPVTMGCQTYTSDSFKSTLINPGRGKAELSLWVETKATLLSWLRCFGQLDDLVSIK